MVVPIAKCIRRKIRGHGEDRRLQSAIAALGEVLI